MNRKFAILYSIIIAGICTVFWTSNQNDSKSGPEIDQMASQTLAKITNGNIGDKKHRDRSTSSKETLSEKVTRADGNADELIELASKLPTFSNNEIIRVYARQFKDFSPDQFAQLMLVKSSSLEGAIVRYIAKSNRIELLQQVSKLLPLGSDERRNLLREAGEQMECFSPENIAGSLKTLGTDDRLSLGKGLAARIGTTLSEEHKMELLDSYLASTDDPAVRSEIQAMWLTRKSLDNPQATSEWLLQQDSSEYVYPSDKVVISALASQSPAKATDFVNQLLDRGENKRASRAVNVVLDTVKHGNPVEVARWIENLPEELPDRNNLSSAAFGNLYSARPEAVLKFIEETPDPKMRAFYSRLKKSLDADEPGH